MANEQFRFPDELENATEPENDIEVEIVDDTPEEDRGRVPLPKNIVEELDNDDLEEYSEKVKKRLSQMKKVWHDERREKERVSREREEALRFAQQAYEENKQLRQQLGAGEQIFIGEVAKAANLELAAAKEKLKQAYESGDAELITDAQEALTDAKLRIKEVERFQPTLQSDNTSVQNTNQVQAPPPAPSRVVDQKAEEWRQRNEWFGADEEMTALAYGLHEKLVRSGVDPRSDDYYRRIDETIRRRFPERFEDAEPVRSPKAPARKAATVVAPVTRGTAPRQVRLTPSQVAIAKRLGLTNEAYARELIKLENDNG
jgi:basic membrane lipoprotein Med (substrate-binding protein (PBP1-ABC) superfamily)